MSQIMKMFKKIVSLFLVAFFLLGSTGIHIYKSYCNITGASSIAFYSNELNCNHQYEIVEHSCCKQSSNQANSIEKKCCDLEQINLEINLNYFSYSPNFSFHNIVAVVPNEFIHRASLIKEYKKEAHFIYRGPPPLYGKQRLYFIATLRI